MLLFLPSKSVSLICLVTFSVVASSQANAQTNSPSAEQVALALDLADSAAKSGLMELSMEAVSRALAYGPPRHSTALPDGPLLHQGARIDTTRPVPDSPVTAVRKRIPRAVLELQQRWTGASEVRVFETLQKIVIPPGQDRILLYSLPMQVDDRRPESLPPCGSVAAACVDAAARCQRLTALRTEVSRRSLAQSAEGRLLMLMCSFRQGHLEQLGEDCRQLTVLIGQGCEQSTAELAADVGRQLLNTAQQTESAAGLLKAAADRTLALGPFHPEQRSPAFSMTLVALRALLAADDHAAAVELIRQLLKAQLDHDPAANRRAAIRALLRARALTDLANQLPELTEPAVAADVPSAKALLNYENTAVPDPDLSGLIWCCRLALGGEGTEFVMAFPDFQHVSSMTVSSDGTHLLLAASRPGEVMTSGARIYVAETSTAQLRCLGPGTHPSWSPNGRRLVCCSYSPNKGIWMMNADGTERRRLDENGWAPKWSPDGCRLAWSRSDGPSRLWLIYDFAEDSLISVGTSPKNGNQEPVFCWSADSRQLQIATEDSVGAQNVLRVLDIATGTGHDTGFTSDVPITDVVCFPNDPGQLLISGRVSTGTEQLKVLSVDHLHPSASPDQPASRRNRSPSLTAERQIYFLSRPGRDEPPSR
ncbi:MAG: hypothetical protein R3C49_10335 [Planctomycetaceae bacterium]